VPLLLWLANSKYNMWLASSQNEMLSLGGAVHSNSQELHLNLKAGTSLVLLHAALAIKLLLLANRTLVTRSIGLD
jgi:hypothetical protein